MTADEAINKAKEEQIANEITNIAEWQIWSQQETTKTLVRILRKQCEKLSEAVAAAAMSGTDAILRMQSVKLAAYKEVLDIVTKPDQFKEATKTLIINK